LEAENSVESVFWVTKKRKKKSKFGNLEMVWHKFFISKVQNKNLIILGKNFFRQKKIFYFSTSKWANPRS
jgi:hypothetical protein